MLLSHVLVFYIHMCATFFTKLVYIQDDAKYFIKMLHGRDTHYSTFLEVPNLSNSEKLLLVLSQVEFSNMKYLMK